MNQYIGTIVFCIFLSTVIGRGLPFVFASKLSGNKKIKVVGKKLTAYIMMLLVIYEINPATFKSYPFALPALISLLFVILAHLYIKKPLLSMVLGTTSYVILHSLLSSS